MSFNVVSKIDDYVEINHVLMSVSDKSNLDLIVNGLIAVNPNVKIYSTGGTFVRVKEILGKKAEKNLVAVADFTGQPEMQGGLVKTLDFKIYLGMLSETYNDSHQKDLVRVGGVNFDMVVVNLYPFTQTITKEGVTLEMARGNIDIGGPCMTRASAKNFIRVASICNPEDYSMVIEEMKLNNGKISYQTRFKLAKKSFEHTAQYDKVISDYLNSLDLVKASEIYQRK